MRGTTSTSVAFLLLVMVAAGCSEDPAPEAPEAADRGSTPPADPPEPEAEPEAPQLTDAERLVALHGELLVRRHRCLACHQADGAAAERLFAEPAPSLEGVASRVSPNWLREYLAQPASAHPGTTMPALVVSLPEDQREAAVEDLLHFLASTGAGFDATGKETDGAQVEQGRRLFHAKGCVSCHLPRSPAEDFDDELGEFHGTFDAMAAAGVSPEDHRAFPRTWVPLPSLPHKTHLEALTAFLLDPTATRPAAAMPDMLLQPQEARSIALYLLSEAETGTEERFPGLRYDYYEQTMGGTLPDFEAMVPTRSGKADRAHLSAVEHRENEFALRFHGGITIPRGGEWTFFIRSDDGSRLFIDGQQLLDNDGTHPVTEKSGTLNLAEGEHSFLLTFFEKGGGQEVTVLWQGPGQDRQVIPDEAYSRSSRTFAPVDPGELAFDATRADRGRQHFVQLGCANCHSVGGQDLAPRTPAPPAWKALVADRAGGCLGEAPGVGVPRYSLTTEERARLAGEIARASQPTPPLAAEDLVVRTLAERNCYACHDRGGIGGPGDQRRLYFTTVGKVDMGEEGKIPPPLNFVGSKLRPQTLRGVLSEKLRARPHMATAMPHYDHPDVAALAGHLASLDGQEGDLDEPEFELDLAEAGRHLVGKDGLGCIQCHGFAGHPSLGIPAGDLAGAYERLNHGWYDRYMRKPFKMRPGTRMPSYFSDSGMSDPDTLGGDATAQIDAIWHYLSMGDSAPLPKGLVVAAGTYELVVDDRPVLVGVFMKDVSPRTLCVGFAERAHYAFDSQGRRLAKLWRGNFFNAKGTWDGRAGQLESPPGDSVLDLPPGPALRVLADAADPWMQTAPTTRWNGRSLDEEFRPTFHYEVDGLEVFETPFPELKRGGSVMHRRFEVRSPTAPEGVVVLRLALGEEVQPAGEADGATRYRVLGFGTVSMEGAVGEAMVCGEAGAQELRVPLLMEEDAGAYVGRCEVTVQW